MKKIAVVLLVLSIIISMGSLFSYAEDKSDSIIEIPYGNTKVSLKLVETFDDSEDADPSYGSINIENGEINMTSTTNCFDRYGITTPMLKKYGALTGAKYIVFSLINESEDACWFCFQPKVSGAGNVFLSGTMGLPIHFVDKNGKETTITEFAGNPSNNNARYSFEIPYGFEGYVFIPVELICKIKEWDTPLFKDADPKFLSVGFNIYGDNEICSFFDVTIYDMFYTEELPEYSEPVATDTPVPTDTPTITDTPSPTNTPEPKEQTTENPTAETKETTKSGCGSSIVNVGGGMVMAFAVVCLKKRKK